VIHIGHQIDGVRREHHRTPPGRDARQPVSRNFGALTGSWCSM